jgi:hypothetical protein
MPSGPALPTWPSSAAPSCASTLLFTNDGRVQANGALLRQRYALDIGGGTTDFTGRRGLELLPGTEGGVRLGVQNAAETARALIQRRFPSLRHLEASQILSMLRADETTLYVSGEPVDVGEEIGAALQDTASAILAQVLPRWERTLAQGEVLLFGGGGATPLRPHQQHPQPTYPRDAAAQPERAPGRPTPAGKRGCTARRLRRVRTRRPERCSEW